MQQSDDRGDGSATAAAAIDALTISFRALQRCRTTIEDFCLTYFPLHGLKLPDDLFRYMDVLLYVEATIYQMDEENERAQEQRQQEQRQQQQSGAAAAADDGGSSGGSARRGVLKEEEEEEQAAFPAAAALEAVLRARGLWDNGIADELAAGYRYWRLERTVCAAMARHDLAAGWRRAQAARYAERKRRKLEEGQQQQQQEEQQQDEQHQEQQQLPPLPAPPPELSAGFTPADALAAHEAKSFDYRVLHRVLLKLVGGRRGGEMPQDCCAHDDNISDLLEFLRLDERLVDIGDDLTDYEDDVVAGGAFNVYRAFLHLYGPRAPLVLADHIGALEAARARALAKLPKWQQDLVEARAKAAAGGRQGADKWVFPTPILNEAGFRRRVLADEAGGGERM